MAVASKGSSEASASSAAASIGAPPSRSAESGSTLPKRKPAKPGNSDSFAIFSCTSGAARVTSSASQS